MGLEILRSSRFGYYRTTTIPAQILLEFFSMVEIARLKLIMNYAVRHSHHIEQSI